MKRILLFAVFLMVQLGFGQTNTWDGSSNNNWNEPANWSLNAVPTNAHDVVIPATFTSVINVDNAVCKSLNIIGTLTIGDSDTDRSLTVSGNVTINGGGVLQTVGNGGNTLLIGGNLVNDGTFDMNVGGADAEVTFNGVLTQTISGTGTTTDFNSITLTNAFPLVINRGITVDGNWINNGKSVSGSGLVTFTGNSIISGPSVTAFPNLTITGTVLQGVNTTVSGNFTLNSGTYRVNYATSYTLTIGGNYNQTGGVFDFNAGNSGTSNVYLAGNLTNSAGSGSISTKGVVKNGILTFNGSGIQTLNMPIAGAAIWAKYVVNTGSTLKLASNLTLNSAGVTTQADWDWVGELTVNGTLDCGTFQVSQSGTTGVAIVNLNSGATFITANPSGIDGSVLSTNLIRTLSPGANYNFNGTVAQNTSAGMPATVNSLTLSNPLGVTVSKATTVTNNFSIGSGTVANLGTFTHRAKFLVLGGTSYASQSWGSTSSPATNKTDVYFATTTGIVNVNAYCTPSATTVRPITFVSFNEIQNTSSGTTAYEDFTTSVSSANVIKGLDFTLGVRANTGGDNTHFLMVYIDWNQDGDFADGGESLQIGTIKNSNGTENNKLASVYFSVPTTATIGLTRMRIISSSTAYSADGGCSINTGTNGQAEDYLINIIDSCSGTPAPGATVASANPVCPNVPFTLNFTNQVLNGIQYVWESSSDGSSWSGATSNPISFFTTDFSTAPAGSNVYGTNATITGGELILTPATGSLYGGFKIQKTLASAGLPSINAFTTKFKYRAFDGSGADGISLSYGASLGNNAGPGEEGEGSGLRLCLDTFDNDGGDTGSRVRIYYNNSFIFQNRIGSYDLRNAVYREVVLSVSNSGFLTLTIGGTTIVSGLNLPNYTAENKSTWNFKFSARTGRENDKQSIDDIDIKYLDILTSNVLFTTQQTVATYYRVKATCANGGGFDYSTPLLVNVDPVAPIIGTITQPTCALATGSVALSGLPSSGSWTITATPATSGLTGLTGTNVDNTSIGGLTANTSYTFVVSNGTCSSIASAAAVVNAIPTTATWNGAWTGTTPAGSNPLLTQPIVFNGDYTSTGDINGCSCTVTSGNVVINSGHTMTITNAVNVTNNATTSLVFEDQSSLVQTTNVTNTGAIEYRRKSAAMKNFDYTYWSSPVTGQNIVALSPNTLADKYFRFSGSADDWEFYNGTMVPGVGYIIRVPKPGIYGAPYPETVVMPYAQPVAFKGIPNNGDYTFGVGANQYNLIGNPYPSAIDADSFMTNTNNASIINGALYFWTHNTVITNNEYTADDYASYTLTGGTGTGVGVGNFVTEWVDANSNQIVDSGEFTDRNGNGFLDKLPEWVDANNNNVFESGEWNDVNNNNKLDLPTFEVTSNRPLGKIAAGQSFFVENSIAGSFQFTNAMRVAGNNSQFFKQANIKKNSNCREKPCLAELDQ